MLPSDPKERKRIPVYSGFIAYFPDAIAEVAKLSQIGNDQHNPGTPLHWDRSKSRDEMDAMMRHVLDRFPADQSIGEQIEHQRAVAWRAMAELQKLCEVRDAPRTERVGKAPLVIQDTHTGLEYRITSCPGTVVKPNVHEVMRELRLRDD